MFINKIKSPFYDSLNKRPGRAPRPSKVLQLAFFYIRNVRKTPAATAEPITPATFGPIAGISGLT